MSEFPVSPSANKTKRKKGAVKSVTDSFGNSWVVDIDDEVVEIRKQRDIAEEKITHFVVVLKSGNNVVIPYHSVSRWVEFGDKE